MLNETHLRLLRNMTIFADKATAVASFASDAAKNLANADGTPRLARFYANGPDSAVKTILGIFHADTKTYTLFDADSESSAQMQQEIDLIEEALGLDENGEYIPYSAGTHTSGATSMTDAVNTLDDALAEEEEKSDEISAKTDALAATKVDRTELVWTKAVGTSVARNTKNQKVAQIDDNGELWLYVEGEYMSVNDLLGQLAHETYDYTEAPAEGTTVVANPESAEELIAADQLIVSGDLNGAVNNNKMVMSGDSIVVNLAEVDNAHTDVVANGDIVLNDLVASGTLPKSISNAGISINTDGDVVIDGGSWNQSGYNGYEIGLNKDKAPQNVTIQNVNVTAAMNNNAILIFGTQDDATINIKDCYFEKVSNVLRLSNHFNSTGITVNIENVEVGEWDSDPGWAGLIILEDYLPYNKQAGDVANANVFGDGKITINIKNLVYKGQKIMPENLADVVATRNADTQVIYMWNNYETGASADFVPYDAENLNRWPNITFE